ncbi:hypothetical protein HYU72_00580, partial [Candidatus Berkelbacteria bacterium]|nr:hypothetical protein [Candidatus Berkelbacteria bacterium]
TTSAAIDKDGTIYYGAVNGHLYALGTNSKDMMAGVVKSPTKDMLTIYLAGVGAIVLIVGAIIVLKKFRIRRL